MHAPREGHKHAGRWLAQNIGDEDWLIDPLSWTEWYAGRTLYNTPVYHGQPKVKWVVVEEGKKEANPHSRIPQWERANEEIKKGVKVFSWPEHPQDKVPTVCVYKVIVEQPKPSFAPQPAPVNPPLPAQTRIWTVTPQ